MRGTPDPDLPFTHREVSRPIDVSASAAKVGRGSRLAARLAALHIGYQVLGVLLILPVLWGVMAIGGEDAGVVLVVVGVTAAWIWVAVRVVRFLVKLLRRRERPRKP